MGAFPPPRGVAERFLLFPASSVDDAVMGGKRRKSCNGSESVFQNALHCTSYPSRGDTGEKDALFDSTIMIIPVLIVIKGNKDQSSSFANWIANDYDNFALSIQYWTTISIHVGTFECRSSTRVSIQFHFRSGCKQLFVLSATIGLWLCKKPTSLYWTIVSEHEYFRAID